MCCNLLIFIKNLLFTFDTDYQLLNFCFRNIRAFLLHEKSLKVWGNTRVQCHNTHMSVMLMKNKEISAQLITKWNKNLKYHRLMNCTIIKTLKLHLKMRFWNIFNSFYSNKNQTRLSRLSTVRFVIWKILFETNKVQYNTIEHKVKYNTVSRIAVQRTDPLCLCSCM